MRGHVVLLRISRKVDFVRLIIAQKALGSQRLIPRTPSFKVGMRVSGGRKGNNARGFLEGTTSSISSGCQKVGRIQRDVQANIVRSFSIFFLIPEDFWRCPPRPFVLFAEASREESSRLSGSVHRMTR